MEIYFGLTNREYHVGEPLSEKTVGAEGYICEIINDSSIVAKIYHEDRLNTDSLELETKLKMMVKKNVVEHKGVFTIAWPRDLLYKKVNGNTKFYGYVMCKINARYSLYNLIRKNDTNFKNVTWKQSVQAAYNLAWFVNYLHTNGIELGDFNEKNFLFDEETGGFSLIDCGTYGIFDLNNHKSIYPSKYTMPMYCAPEKLEGIQVSDPRYTDYFYLAIHIFNLLTNNANPFRSVPVTAGDNALFEAIRNGECIYVKKIAGKSLPPDTLGPGLLPEDILAAFNNTFNYKKETIRESVQKRTTALQWCKVLNKYLNDTNKIKKCNSVSQHYYSSHLSKCPWCYPDSVSKCSYEELYLLKEKKTPVSNINNTTKIQPNELCPCGSGKKYKNCHGKQTNDNTIDSPTKINKNLQALMEEQAIFANSTKSEHDKKTSVNKGNNTIIPATPTSNSVGQKGLAQKKSDGIARIKEGIKEKIAYVSLVGYSVLCFILLLTLVSSDIYEWVFQRSWLLGIGGICNFILCLIYGYKDVNNEKVFSTLLSINVYETILIVFGMFSFIPFNIIDLPVWWRILVSILFVSHLLCGIMHLLIYLSDQSYKYIKYIKPLFYTMIGIIFCLSLFRGFTYASAPFKTGEIISFGHFEQDNNLANGSEELTWTVKTISENKALLVSEKCIYAMDYCNYDYYDQDGNKIIRWGLSDTRYWLNYDFLNEAFSDQEKEFIIETELDTPIIEDGVKSNVSEITTDKIFIEDLYETDTTKYTEITDFAKSNYYYADDGYIWLRNTYVFDMQEKKLSYLNGHENQTLGINLSLGYVRPAMYIDIREYNSYIESIVKEQAETSFETYEDTDSYAASSYNIEESGENSSFQVVIDANGQPLALKALPDLSSYRYTYIPDGTSLTIFETATDTQGYQWGRTNYSGTDGWIYLYYTKTVAD